VKSALVDQGFALLEPELTEAPKASALQRLKAVEWSHSKRGTMDQCPRKYYYEYYGATVRKATQEPKKALLRDLKRLKNRHERAGEIVHLIIAHYFRSAGRHEPMDASRMVSWARQIFSKDLDLSRASGTRIALSNEKHPPAQLLEFFHAEPRAEELCAEAERKIVKALEEFARMPNLRLVRSARGHASMRIERKFRLGGFPCKVSGVVDAAAQTDRAPGVVDWKLGVRSAGEDDSLQLNVYALWGGEEFRCSPETVRIFKAFLGSAEVVRYRCTAATLEKARRRILQDALCIAAMDNYGRNGEANAFTACAQPRLCMLCPYLTACSEGKECLND
jgi:hypothetical protein